MFSFEESITIQLSMKSELVGTQSLLFLNSIFKNNGKISGVAALSMMEITENKIEIK